MNNIIKFVSRDIFEQRKFPLYGYSITNNLDRVVAQMFLEGVDLDEKNTLRAKNYLNSLANEATGVQG
ncbi:MAG: hypothetical protein WCL34_12865 [Methylococcaceae bacterium]